MKRIVSLLAAFLVVGVVSTAQADVIGYTGFENPVSSGTSYGSRYTQIGTVGEALPNQTGTIVNWTSTGDELGFTTYLTSGSGPLGSDESSGDYIGVVNYYNNNGSGSYEAEDVDDEIQLRLDTVDLTDYVDVTVSAYLKTYLSSYNTGYEAADYVSMTVVTDVGTYTLFEADGDELNDLTTANGYSYIFYDVVLSDDATWAQFILTVHTNGSYEGVQLDDVYIEGTYSPVPVPAAVWLLGSGLLGLIGIRRRNA
ncbi:VPLPA-CTERM sorting domain-containing protein [uncultured Desulfosarcina sp.]|uniref:VPLPA-CTERM sorting domain-containing protein n=1 Tax=uncultured Desulfosarcina sp. TaxID=218289 RepID=UPI0029C83A52|nr:VPLPA-CTERM sorting domain-containing protein [uncultured Desulfosarcina sp.]